MKLLLCVVLSISGSFAAHALDSPTRTSSDARIRTVEYNPDEVVALYSKLGAATQIVFGENENILDVASGFGDGWEFKNRRNQLYFKPRSAKSTGDAQGMIAPVSGKWDTNLLVTTDRRVYTFQLMLVGAKDDRAAYRVTFHYPADVAEAKVQSENALLAKSRLAAREVVRNANYSMQVGPRSKAIAPTKAYDDGTFTYLTFPRNREVPAVFLVAEDKAKTETLVNTHFANDVLVIHRVAPSLVLRLGSQVVSIFNEAYDAEGIAPVNGTTVDGIERVIKQEGGQ